MKVAICSDLHLEFGDLDLKNTEGADVLVLSGDILVENDLDVYDRRQYEMGFMRGKSRLYHDFFERVCSEFPHVIYVAGNHESYHGDFAKTYDGLKDKLKRHANLHILDKETFELDDYVFIGSTLWTDMNRNDPLTLEYIRHSMNDFRIIENSNRKTYRKVPIYKKDEAGNYVKDDKGNMIQEGMKMKEEVSIFSPVDAMDEHVKCLAYIQQVYDNLAPWKTAIVVGHHTPSTKSCHPRYAHDDLMNGGYHSDLSEFILDRPAIKLWTHGHTHEDFDYMIGECRVVCNPRGYIKYEARADKFKLKVVEV
jgi:predicted phosphodiesterase